MANLNSENPHVGRKFQEFVQNCKDDSFDFEVEGSTTSSFDSVKQFYLDVYEALGNLLVIPGALNNIKYRADANSMNPLEKNVSSFPPVRITDDRRSEPRTAVDFWNSV